MNIEELKRLALDSKAWYDAGAVITDPYDTYPCELFDAAVDATVVLELISQIERLTAELGDLPEAQSMLLHDCKRKDALLRCIYDNTTMADWPADIEERIEKELGL